MLTLEVLTQAGATPGVSHAVDRRLLDLVREEPRRAWLRVYQLAGDVLSLGRYHVAPTDPPASGVQLHRRLGGGRVIPLGAGFAVLSLTLPHRSALVSDDPLALRPEQVLNRCVRALLAGLRGCGVDAFYPGRDRITVAGRTLGLVSLESDPAGVTVFEAALSVDGDWLRVGDLVAAVDRDGVVAAQVPSAAEVTSLAGLGAAVPLATLAERVASAYIQQFGLQRCVTDIEPSLPPDADEQARVWVASRRVRAGLDHHAIEWSQLGVLEVYLATTGGAIDDIALCGDFIADSPSIDRLEQRLRGVALTPAAVGAMVEGVYADPRSFLLGVGPRSAVVDTILRAQ